VESVVTGKHRIVFFEPEKDFWFVMVVSMGGGGATQQQQQNTVGLEVDDDVFAAVLQQAYRYFRLFNGSIRGVLQRSSLNTLRSLLDVSLQQFMMSLDVQKYGLYDVLDGVHYLPMDRNLVLRSGSFIARMKQRFGTGVKNCMMLFHEHVIWSEMNHEDARALYRFFLRVVPVLQLKQQQQQQHQQYLLDQQRGVSSQTGQPSAQPGIGQGEGRSGVYLPTGPVLEGFLIGPQDLSDPANSAFNSRRVFPHPSESEQLMVLYRYSCISMIIFVDVGEAVNMSFFAALRAFILPEVGDLEAGIAAYYQRSSVASALHGPSLAASGAAAAAPSRGSAGLSPGMPVAQQSSGASFLDDDVKYIYFNNMNLAIKTNIRTRIALPRDVMVRLTQIHSDLQTGTILEAFEHTLSGFWIVARKSGDREMFAVIEKSVSFPEADERIKRLASSLFQSIYFPLD
jgi:hypothetical protein